MATLVTSIDPVTGGVLISWSQPDDNSQTLISFTILIGSTDGVTFFEDETDCSGVDPLVTQCLVPMTTLTAAPFNLQFDQLVLVKAHSTNFFGVGPDSNVNIDGVKIMKIPSQMGPISVISKTETEITLAWSSITGVATGNSEITTYNLYWDNSNGDINMLVT